MENNHLLSNCFQDYSEDRLRRLNQSELVEIVQNLQLDNRRLRMNSDKKILYFLEAIQFPVITYDISGNLIAYNKKAEEWISTLSGTPFDGNENLSQTISRSGNAYLKDYYLRALHGELVEFEFSGNDINGKYRCLQAIFIPLFGQDGKVEAVNVTGYEITERKLIVEHQQDVLRQYRAVFDHFPLGIIITDDHCVITEVNQLAEDLLGIDKDEVVNRDLRELQWDMIRPDGSEIPKNENPEAVAYNENRFVEDVEVGVRRKDGLISWLSVTAAPVPIEKYGLVVTYSDISKRIIAENALKQIEERYRMVVQDQTAFICRYLPDGVITFINEAFQQFFTTEEPQLLGLNLFQLMHPENWIEFKNSLKKCTRHQNVTKFEHKLTLSDFREVWISWTNRVIIDDKDQIVEYQSVGIDITEKKIIERQEQKLIDNLKIIYHDLENFSQLLKTDIFKSDGMTLEQFGITHQEQKVISLVLKGMKNKEIAAKLYMGESTVKKYLSDIYSKVQIKNRVELVNFIKDHQIAI